MYSVYICACIHIYIYIYIFAQHGGAHEVRQEALVHELEEHHCLSLFICKYVVAYELCVFVSLSLLTLWISTNIMD